MKHEKGMLEWVLKTRMWRVYMVEYTKYSFLILPYSAKYLRKASWKLPLWRRYKHSLASLIITEWSSTCTPVDWGMKSCWLSGEPNERHESILSCHTRLIVLDNRCSITCLIWIRISDKIWIWMFAVRLAKTSLSTRAPTRTNFDILKQLKIVFI
jgi:hypothetical protein